MGGSGLVATKLGLELANRGHDVHFLFYKEPFYLEGKDIAKNITFHLLDRPSYALFKDIGAPYTIQAASKMVSIVKEHQIDIIHSHYLIPHAVSAYLAKQQTKVKIVNTAHGSDIHTLGLDDSYNPTISLALDNSDAITAVSNYLATETQNVYDLDNKVETVYNFIEPDQFTPYEGEKEKSIIQASNFRPIKRLPMMIEVFGRISQEFPEWQLKLVGYGPEYPICVRRSRELGIRDKVKFLGVRKDIPLLIAKSSVLASTSKIESFGLTIAEAMSCETPVWAPRTGGIPEICVDGESGILFDGEDLDDAENSLRQMLSQDGQREIYGRNGRKRIQEVFSPKVIVRQYEAIYDNLI